VAKGNFMTKETPKEQWDAIVARKDGTVVRNEVAKEAQQGDTVVREKNVDKALRDNERAARRIGGSLGEVLKVGMALSVDPEKENFVAVFKPGSEPDALPKEHLIARQNGEVSINGQKGFDCKLAKEATALVKRTMRDGKLSVEDVAKLEEFVSNAPNPQGKQDQCSPKR